MNTRGGRSEATLNAIRYPLIRERGWWPKRKSISKEEVG